MFGFIKKYSSNKELTQQTFVLMKRSSRRLDQDEYICLSHTFSEYIFRTSCKSVFKHFQNIFKTFWRCLQQFFKTPLRLLAKTPSRLFKDVYKTSSSIFKTSCKNASKKFSRRIIRLNCLFRSRIFLGHTSKKFMVSEENLQVW